MSQGHIIVHRRVNIIHICNSYFTHIFNSVEGRLIRANLFPSFIVLDIHYWIVILWEERILNPLFSYSNTSYFIKHIKFIIIYSLRFLKKLVYHKHIPGLGT